MKRILFGFIVITLTSAALTVTAHEPDETPETNRVAHVTWAFEARTLPELIAEADLIVIAEHGLARPGRVAGHGGGAVPFTIHGFIVHSVLKGHLDDDLLLVEQTGGRLPNGEKLEINDGGPFLPEERYLLFLEDQGNGLYFQINHQGRFQLTGERLAGVMPADPVIASLHGRRLGKALSKIDHALAKPLPKPGPTTR